MTYLKTLRQLEEIQQKLNAVREHCRNRNLEKALASESLREKESIENSIQENCPNLTYHAAAIRGMN